MRVAVDAMGGDHAPREIVGGAVRAATSIPALSRLILVGDRERIGAELDRIGTPPDKIEVHHASEVIEMDDSPAQAVRRKKDSSINQAVELVKEDAADAVVSAGNTGAFVVAATLKLRTLEEVARAGIAAVMPTERRPVVLIDAGANIECDARLLAQFAAMGTVYSREILKQENPVVGVLSIGGEDVKGNDVTREAFQLLSQSHLNFRGNVEGHDLFRGETDVVVCDGFIGNIVLKTSESAAVAIGHWLKQEVTRTPIRMMGSVLLRGCICGHEKTYGSGDARWGAAIGSQGRLYHHPRCIVGQGYISRDPRSLRINRKPGKPPDYRGGTAD